MIAYSYDDKHYYSGTVERQLDPLETERTGKPVYLLPADAAPVPPPALTETQRAVWNGRAWTVEEIPPAPAPAPQQPASPSLEERVEALEEAQREQAAAYRKGVERA